MRLVARISSDQVSSKTDVTMSSYEGFKFTIPPPPSTIPGGLTQPRLPRRAGVSGRQGGIREVSGRQGRGLNCEIKKLFLEIQFSTKFTSWGVSGGRLYYARQIWNITASVQVSQCNGGSWEFY